jgi:tRNA threonylcarbamoyladenosine biosynthesis protein TsaB
VLGVALTEQGALVADLAWRTRAGAAAELLPAVEQLLHRAGLARTAITAVFVCLGPGSYAGLRVGVSTAMGLAYTLGAGLLGVPRLEADAYVHAAASAPIVPVHAAGRGDFAWAVYASAGGWRELAPARLSRPDALIADAPNALLCGEIDDELAGELRTSRPDLTIRCGPAHTRRAVTLAALAWTRYQAGARDSSLGLEPIYLREPHITPRKSEWNAR